MVAGRVAPPVVVPILRFLEDAIEVLVGDDTKRIQNFVFDRLNRSLDVGLQIW